MEKKSNDPCFNLLSEELGIAPAISPNVCKVLDECIRSMAVSFPPPPKEKDKDRVRRPMNAFMIYSQTARKAMAKYYPTLSYRKLSKALGKIWRVLDPAEKKPFIDEAQRLRILHKREHPDFKFTSNKKRKAKRNVAKTTETKSLPNVQDLLNFIQQGNLSQTFDELREDVGSEQKVTLPNFAAESKDILERASFDILFPRQPAFDSSFQMGSNSTWNAFSAHEDNAPPSPTNNDEELLSILDSILNDLPPAAASVGAQPSTPQLTSLQLPNLSFSNPNFFAPGHVTTNDGLLASSWNDLWNTPYSSDSSSFPNLQPISVKNY
jgi:hypothetical protein